MALELIVELCKTLAAEKIDYCHWKSNEALERSASGENDLDLLVNRADGERFTEILYRLGFVEAQAADALKLPGVLDYYGYDQLSGRLIHVHTHFQLVLGNDLSKNYRLPIELPYLKSAQQGDLFRVPAPEFELLVFVLRMTLKHSTWDAILMRHGELSASERRELAYLATPQTLEKVDLARAHFPAIYPALFYACLQSLQPECPLRMRMSAGEQLQKALNTCARYPKTLDILQKIWRRVWRPIQSRLFKYEPKRRMANGGLLIALVGGDGSGKTTAIDALYPWLSGKFETKRVHMGKPQWSGITMFVRGLLKIGTALRLYSFEKLSEAEFYASGNSSTEFPGYPSLIRTVCTARDRYLTYLQIRRFTSNGGLVICDRYPFPGFLEMDSPQCERVTRAIKPNGFLNWLTQLENSYYQQILPPDLLIVLKVDPEIAVKRKTDESEVSVRARSTRVWRLNWEKVNARVIDASRPKAEILAEIKALVWSHF